MKSWPWGLEKDLLLIGKIADFNLINDIMNPDIPGTCMNSSVRAKACSNLFLDALASLKSILFTE